jgi:hypothetical protein
LKKNINIRLKTLYDKRRVYNFKCNIENPISILLEKLNIEEEKINCEQNSLEKEKLEKNEINKKEKFERFDNNSQYRIISSNVNLINNFFNFLY